MPFGVSHLWDTRDGVEVELVEEKCVAGSKVGLSQKIYTPLKLINAYTQCSHYCLTFG